MLHHSSYCFPLLKDTRVHFLLLLSSHCGCHGAPQTKASHTGEQSLVWWCWAAPAPMGIHRAHSIWQGMQSRCPKANHQCAKWTHGKWFSTSHPHLPSGLSASINGLRELQFDLAVKPSHKVCDSPPVPWTAWKIQSILKGGLRKQKNGLKHAQICKCF